MQRGSGIVFAKGGKSDVERFALSELSACVREPVEDWQCQVFGISMRSTKSMQYLSRA